MADDHPDQPAAVVEPKPSRSPYSPHLQSILISIILIGTGTVIGYMAFHTQFHYQCINVLNNVHGSHNTTLAQLQDRLNEKDNLHKQCMEDETRVKEVYELRGRLESQSDLAASHRALLDQHQRSLKKIQQLELGQQVDELDRLREELHVVTQKLEESRRHVVEDRQFFADSLANNQHLLESVRNHLSQRESVQCRQWFETDGPYYVEFQVALLLTENNDDQEPEQQQEPEASVVVSFVVELATRKQLPHSVYTFLTLVESGTYNDAAFISYSHDQKVLQISGENTSNRDLESHLHRLGFPNGVNGVLAFLEESPSLPCQANSIGFVQRGPNLKLFLEDGAEWGADGAESTCFGRVVRGMEHMPEIKRHLVELQKRIGIQRVSYLTMD